MDTLPHGDPAEIMNARARAEGWPVQCFSALAFDDADLNGLAVLWLEKLAGQDIPYRRDLDARALKPVLRKMTIAERIREAGRIRYCWRFFGLNMADRLGDGTGRCFDETIPSHLVVRWHAIHDAVLDTGRPLRALSTFDHPLVNYLIGESLLAPLRNNEGEPNLVLAATSFRSRVDQNGERPMRFDHAVPEDAA